MYWLINMFHWLDKFGRWCHYVLCHMTSEQCRHIRIRTKKVIRTHWFTKR